MVILIKERSHFTDKQQVHGKQLVKNEGLFFSWRTGQTAFKSIA